MKTNALRINTLSERGFTWYLDYLSSLDAKDLDRYGSFLDESCQMQTNNAAAVVGKGKVLAALDKYWKSFGTLEHDLLNIYGDDTSFALEALNHYTRLDGAPITLRAVALTDRTAAGQVASFRLFTDTAPLFSSQSAR